MRRFPGPEKARTIARGGDYRVMPPNCKMPADRLRAGIELHKPDRAHP